MRRAVELVGLEKELELSKVTEVKVAKKFIELTEMPDGTWRMIYSSSAISDISKLESMRIIRED